MVKKETREAVVARIKSLWAEGYSYQYIATMVGVCKTTVKNTVKGEPKPEVKKRPEQPNLLDPVDMERCPQCGHVVEMPCKLCLATWRASPKRLKPEDFEGVDIASVLRECSTYKGVTHGKVSKRKRAKVK